MHINLDKKVLEIEGTILEVSYSIENNNVSVKTIQTLDQDITPLIDLISVSGDKFYERVEKEIINSEKIIKEVADNYNLIKDGLLQL